MHARSTAPARDARHGYAVRSMYVITYRWLDATGTVTQSRIKYRVVDLTAPPTVAALLGVSGAVITNVHVSRRYPYTSSQQPVASALTPVVVVYTDAVIRLPVDDSLALSVAARDEIAIDSIVTALQPIADAIGAGDLIGVL